MKVLIALVTILLTGCVCLNPNHRQGNAPSVDTSKVVENLKDTKEELKKAGEANTEVGKSVDKALTLAQRLDSILEEIERSQNKNVIKPE